MTEQLLPIGSVVTVKQDPLSSYMIVGFFPMTQDKDMYDYLAVEWPGGFLSYESQVYLNENMIEEIIYRGYIEKAHEALLEKIPKMIADMDSVYELAGKETAEETFEMQ